MAYTNFSAIGFTRALNILRLVDKNRVKSGSIPAINSVTATEITNFLNTNPTSVTANEKKFLTNLRTALVNKDAKVDTNRDGKLDYELWIGSGIPPGYTSQESYHLAGRDGNVSNVSYRDFTA